MFSALVGVVCVCAAATGEGDAPSTLDKLDAKNIPAIEKFSWQPQELVAILGEHRGRQGGWVTSVVISRNGKLLASASNNGMVRFWDQATMRFQQQLSQPAGCFGLSLSKDSTLLAGGGGDGYVRLWDLGSEPYNEKAALKVASSAIHAVSLAPDANAVVAGGLDGRVALWDLEGSSRQTASGETHKGAIHAVSFSPDGKTIASGSADKSLRLWSVLKDKKLKEKAVADALPAAVLSVAFHPTDEKALVCGCADGTVRFWNIAGAKVTSRTVLKTTGGAVNALAYSPNGKILATAHGDGTCRSWMVTATGATEKSLLEGHVGPATAITFSPDNTTLLSGGGDWTVRQWPAVSGPKPRDKTIQSGHLSHVYSMNFSPDGTTMVSGGNDSRIRFWDFTGAEPKEKPPTVKNEGAALMVVHAPDGKTLAAGGGSGNFRTYDTKTHRFIHTFQGHTLNVNGLAYSADGSLIASASSDKTVRLWNAKTGKEVHSFGSLEALVYSVAFSKDGKYLITASGESLVDKAGRSVLKNGAPLYHDSSVRVFEVENKKEVFRWKNDNLVPQAVGFAPDDKHFYVGTTEGLVRSWSWPDPEPPDPVIIKKGATAFNPLAISPDRRYLATLAEGGVALLDPESGNKLRHWVFKEYVVNVGFAPDSKHLAVGLGTGVIYILRL